MQRDWKEGATLGAPATDEKSAPRGTVRTKRFTSLKDQPKKFSRQAPAQRAARLVEGIYRCKWSLTVYALLESGVNRPGQMVRQVEGLSTKVLNQCLKRNLRFGILSRTAYAEVPPRVEYAVTPFGRKFLRVLKELQALQEELAAGTG
jgi:DNA-binding HxlR family transcriptional regulator